MLLTDLEVESSLLISSDEGATYQKYRLSFYILSLLFHPEQEDWILAYGHDQKVKRIRSIISEEGGENNTHNLIEVKVLLILLSLLTLLALTRCLLQP